MTKETISSEVMLITPQIAKEMLTHNIVNRKLAVKRVHSYAMDIKNGAWELNGESIRFNTDGELVDGQHRLSAIIEANIPVQMYVTTGVDSNITLYDRGRVRDEADSLLISGMPKNLANKSVISIAKLHYAIQIKEYNTTPYSYIKDFLEENKDALIKVYTIAINSHVGRSGNVSIRSASLLLPYFYVLTVYPEKVDEITRFLKIVKTGLYESTKHESSAIILRNDIIQGYVSSESREKRIKAVFIVEKALYDFINKIDRKVTYKNAGARIYSNDKRFKIDTKKYK